MSTKPNYLSPYRKPVGSFVNDSSVSNLLQQSPRQDLISFDRGAFAMPNHNSKTNFIVESSLPEGPRAVTVSQDGEKHSLDEDLLGNSTNPFTPIQAPMSPSTISPSTISTPLANPPTSCTNIQNSSSVDRQRASSTSKRSKGSRRYINQKPRPVFTPRNGDRITPRSQSEDRKFTNQNFNAQTQTDTHLPSIPLHHTLKYHTMPGTPPPVAPPRRFIRENVGDMVSESPRMQPLRVLPPRKKSKIKDFSELRSIASALTLITVVSWLFSTFFELEGIVEIFTSLLHGMQTWYAKHEQPMTKAEYLVQYVRSLWA